MSVDQAFSAEELAQLFHQYRRILANCFGCETPETEASWEDTRPKERKVMVATMRLVISDLAAKMKDSAPRPAARTNYFAKPGEAEWGC
ncbi:MAG TPA: hypothetical protein VEI50_16465 [Nitrospiraceae bacterium]|nr:hypothetical protein [Nitrospiraceae bacterium]